MDTRKEDANVKTAPAPEAPARPAPGAVPSAEPLHGPVEASVDSLDGLQTALEALSVEEVVSQPVKRKGESEKDAGDEADEGEEQGQDRTNVPTFEGAPSASGLHASPSTLTTTLPIPDPAAATSTPITNPPMAEGTGFTGMPPYPAYGMGPPTTALPEATTASEPVASSSATRWYAAEYPHPLPATGTYVDVPGYAPGYATLSGLRRGPESLGGRSRGSGRSSNRSLTRSEINEVLRGATSKIVGDLTQEIREKLEPQMIPALLLAYLWLGLSWIDWISSNKSFSSSKTSSRKPYTSSKQQERQKHSAETTINFSVGRKNNTWTHVLGIPPMFCAITETGRIGAERPGAYPVAPVRHPPGLASVQNWVSLGHHFCLLSGP